MGILKGFLSDIFCFLSASFIGRKDDDISKASEFVYKVTRLKEAIEINGKWEKPEWENIEAIELNNFIKEKPGFWSSTSVKMVYDDNNLYVIFNVHDRYVRCITTKINGPVWKDSAVEFFFSPNVNLPLEYFNLEINCGGTPLLGYHPSSAEAQPTIDDIRKIEIGHSLPEIVDPEITECVTWTIECKIPIEILKKFSEVTCPKPGIIWKTNFYKIAENNSNPHYLTWANIEHPEPNFHLPQHFGNIEFQ